MMPEPESEDRIIIVFIDFADGEERRTICMRPTGAAGFTADLDFARITRVFVAGPLVEIDALPEEHREAVRIARSRAASAYAADEGSANA